MSGESEEFTRAVTGVEAEAADDDYEPDNVQRYLAEIGTHPLMIAEEERAQRPRARGPATSPHASR